MADKKEKALAKKTFNAVAAGLFREISKLFPSDAKVLFLMKELETFSASKEDAHIPAMKFFRALNAASGIPSLAVADQIAPVGELIINKDTCLFTDAKASIPELDIVDFKGKWATLSAENRSTVWNYLERMATLSAKVATLESLKPEDLLELSQAMSAAGGSGNPNAVAALMQDPKILNLGQKIGERMLPK